MNNYDARLLHDKALSEGVYSFKPEDMFDRIINLKLTTAERTLNGDLVPKDEYIIRSDWELYYPEMNRVVTQEATTQALSKCYIRRCVQKPAIKVQYKQIATGTAVEIDIFISNFVMLSADGRTLMSFNNLNYPLGQVEIQMGYFGQFNKKPETLDELFDFSKKPNVDTLTVDVGHGYVQTDKLPPDSVLHIHGYVGSCYNPPLSELQGVSIREDYKTLSNPALFYNTYIENYIFTNITRRFIRKPVNSAKIKINKDTGLMSQSDAEAYGVHVYLSDELLQASEERLKLTEAKTADGKIIKKKVTGIYADNVVKAMNLMRDDLGLDIGFKMLNDGNYIAYLQSESGDSEELAKSLEKYKLEDTALSEVGNAVDKVYNNVLPAVYNISTDALCTIVCPFFFFINPFDKLKFASRYALGGIVTYYADFSVAESIFYALYMSVSFATVEDINECTIVCTGSKEN